MSGASLQAMAEAPKSAGLIDRWFAFRDGLLASPAFQRWAVRFPLTRMVANRRARALFDICAGFVYSQVLAACLRLDLFRVLADGPLTAAALSGRLGLSRDATGKLLEAAVALRLIEHRSGGRFGLGVLGAATLGNPGIGAIRSRCCAANSRIRRCGSYGRMRIMGGTRRSGRAMSRPTAR
jgi:demethylspheroidene O-methyltransferase